MHRLDEEYCTAVQQLLLKIFKIEMGIGLIKPGGIKNVRVAGSTAEGAAIARLFRRNDLFPDHLNREMEADFEYILFEIPENLKKNVEDLHGNKTGFLNLKLDLNFLRSVNQSGWSLDEEEIVLILDIAAPNGYLLPYRLKQMALDKLRFNDSDEIIRTAFAYVLSKKLQDISFTDMKEGINKSSMKYEGIVNTKQQPYLALLFDVTHLVRLKWWPGIANEWRTRKRNWPSNENIIKELTKESFVITKPTHNEDADYDTNELRYSFSHVEKQLVEMRSRYQNMSYLIFKSMIYKWLSTIDGEENEIKSFLGKTVMFWVCEANSKEDKTFWKEDYESLLDVLRHLFREMLKYFEAGFMPYYFIPKINVIESIPVATRNKVILKIQAILQNIECHLPSFSDIERWTVELINVTKLLLKLTVDLEDRNWLSIFLQNPAIDSEIKGNFTKILGLKQSVDDSRKAFDFEKSNKIINQACWSETNA